MHRSYPHLSNVLVRHSRRLGLVASAMVVGTIVATEVYHHYTPTMSSASSVPKQVYASTRSWSYSQNEDERVLAFQGFLKLHANTDTIQQLVQKDTQAQQESDRSIMEYEIMCQNDYFYDGWFNRRDEFQAACLRTSQRIVHKLVTMKNHDMKSMKEMHDLYVDLYLTLPIIRYKAMSRPPGMSGSEQEAIVVLSEVGCRSKPTPLLTITW